jgi:glutathione S-transferase
MVSDRASQRVLFGVSALLFAAGAAATIVWCTSMSAIGEMPMLGGWTMSMAWMPMCGQTWPGAAASFLQNFQPPSSSCSSRSRSSTFSTCCRAGEGQISESPGGSNLKWNPSGCRIGNTSFVRWDDHNRKGAHHMITISAFKWVPDFAQGQVRDLRVRWALEEAGLPYKTRLLEQGDQDKPDYRALQPFGQVPILEEDGFVLFESGAIVLYIGERSEVLLPKDVGARATQWLIAALNSIEPFVMNVALIDLFYANEEWAKLRRPGAVEFVQKRLSALSKSLGEKPYLDGDRFTAGDLMMTTVLRILKHTDIVTSDKRLAAYIERCTARPAFKRAFDAQIGDFKEAA